MSRKLESSFKLTHFWIIFWKYEHEKWKLAHFRIAPLKSVSNFGPQRLTYFFSNRNHVLYCKKLTCLWFLPNCEWHSRLFDMCLLECLWDAGISIVFAKKVIPGVLFDSHGMLMNRDWGGQSHNKQDLLGLLFCQNVTLMLAQWNGDHTLRPQEEINFALFKAIPRQNQLKNWTFFYLSSHYNPTVFEWIFKIPIKLTRNWIVLNQMDVKGL